MISSIDQIAKLEAEQEYLFKKVDQVEAQIERNEKELITLKQILRGDKNGIRRDTGD